MFWVAAVNERRRRVTTDLHRHDVCLRHACTFLWKGLQVKGREGTGKRKHLSELLHASVSESPTSGMASLFAWAQNWGQTQVQLCRAGRAPLPYHTRALSLALCLLHATVVSRLCSHLQRSHRPFANTHVPTLQNPV